MMYYQKQIKIGNIPSKANMIENNNVSEKVPDKNIINLGLSENKSFEPKCRRKIHNRSIIKKIFRKSKAVTQGIG